MQPTRHGWKYHVLWALVGMAGALALGLGLTHLNVRERAGLIERMGGVDLDPRFLDQVRLENLLGGNETVNRHTVYWNGTTLSWQGLVTALVYEPSPGSKGGWLYQLEVQEPFPGSILGIHLKDSRAQADAAARKLEAEGEGHYRHDQASQPSEGYVSFELQQLRGSHVAGHWVLHWYIGRDGRVARLLMRDESVGPQNDLH